VLDIADTSEFAEYVDPYTGEACGATGFSWTAALTLDLLHDTDDVNNTNDTNELHDLHHPHDLHGSDDLHGSGDLHDSDDTALKGGDRG
jgi:hypothetical protein